MPTNVTEKKQILLVSKVFGSLWILSLLFGLHGFSLPIWSDLIHEPSFQPLLGKARGIRSDDWAVLQPFALSQRKAEPSFPVVNPLIGEGQNMLLVVTAPVKNQVALFRPHTWGYFVSGDFGLSWCWNFYVYSFLFSFFFLFLLCSRNAVNLSAVGSVALLFSPFFQFWALNCASLAAEGALSVVFATLFFLSRGGRQSILLGTALGWSLTSFAYWLYPAFQIPVVWVGLAIFAGLIWRKSREEHHFKWDQSKTFGIALAIAIPIVSLSLFYLEAKDAINLMAHTVYPGQRVSHGGEFSFWPLFSNNLIPLGWIRGYQFFGNISEAGSSILIYPLVIFIIFKNNSWRRVDPLIITLSLVLVLLTLWTWAPIPDWLATLTGFSRVPGFRSIIGHAIANVALLVTFASLNPKKEKWIYAALWTIVAMLFFKSSLVESPSEPPFKLALWIGYALVINFVLAYAVLNRSKQAVTLLALFHLGITTPFNPLVRGGGSALENSKFAQTLLALERSRESSWVVFGDSSLAIFTRTLGLSTINGVHIYPQLEMWKKLDPKDEYKNITNRYAHVRFQFTKPNETFKIQSPQADVVEVRVSPDDQRFLSLGASYILSQEKLPDEVHSHWRLVKEFESYKIYKRNKL